MDNFCCAKCIERYSNIKIATTTIMSECEVCGEYELGEYTTQSTILWMWEEKVLTSKG